MLNLEQLRKIDPKFKEYTDKELTDIRDKLYELVEFAFENWIKDKNKEDTVL